MSFDETHETGQSNLKIVKFSRRKNYYLYVYDSDTKKVSYASLGSSELEYCLKNWFKTYEKFVKRGGSLVKIKRTSLKVKAKEFIDVEFARYERDEIKEKSFKTIYERMRNRVLPFIEQSGVGTVQELNRKCFSNFGIYWREKGKDVTTINSDITTFRSFLNWLVDEELLDLGKRPEIKKLKVVKDFRTEANPHFPAEDWKIFKETLRRYEYLDESWTDDVEEKERWWFRKMFANWVHFQFHLGSRPHETLKLTFGDVAVKEKMLPNGARTLMGTVHIPSDTKRGERTSVMNGYVIQRTIQHFNSFQHSKWLSIAADDTTPLFLNPKTRKAIHTESLRQHYKKVLEYAGLNNKGYTLYSLRSTHITYQLLNGVTVDDVARNLGTSGEMVRKHYDGVANILKSDELLKLNKHYYQDSNLQEDI